MSLKATNVLTLGDWAKRLDPQGKTSDIVEMLSQTNEVLTDMLWKEGNLPTGHRTTIRTGLPTVAWRLLNQGVQPSKSTTAQIDEACGMLEAWSEVDKELANLNGNTSEFRLSEAQAFIEAMNQEFASTLFYGNSSVSPEEFTGLSLRYSDPAAANGQNIVNGGAAAGQTDCMSIWMLVWGANTIHGIFPKGSKAGLQHEDHGEVTVETTAGIAGTRMRAYQDQWTWKCGVSVRDWRFGVRIANIDLSLNNADYLELMTKAYHRVQSLKMGKAVIYMNRTVRERLDLLKRNDVISGGGITYKNVDGEEVATFRGIPIRTCDALLTTEDALTF